MRPDVLELVAGQRRQNRLADARAVQRTAQADTARHPHRAALGLINVDDVPPVADDEMHGLAGALGQPLQMRLRHAHDVHAVHNAAGQLKHF